MNQICENMTLPLVTFKTRVRVENDEENPFLWKDLTTNDMHCNHVHGPWPVAMAHGHVAAAVPQQPWRLPPQPWLMDTVMTMRCSK